MMFDPVECPADCEVPSFQSLVESDISAAQSRIQDAGQKLKAELESISQKQQQLATEQLKWKDEKEQIDATMKFLSNTVVLNVGGKKYHTSLSTLTKQPDAMLGVMFSGRHDLKAAQCEDGSYFIDRNGEYFYYVLNYLRDGKKAVLPADISDRQSLRNEAEFFQLTELSAMLDVSLNRTVTQDMIDNELVSSKCTVRLDHARATEPSNFDTQFTTSVSMTFKCKVMTKLRFYGIYFRHPVCFEQCDLSGSSFQYCYFTFGAKVKFNNCILNGTSFYCVGGLTKGSSFLKSNMDEAEFDCSLKRHLGLY